MFCSQCGKQLKDDARFCSSCGTKIETSNAKTNQTIKNKSDIRNKCMFCGEALSEGTKRCPSCDNEVREVKSTITNRTTDEIKEIKSNNNVVNIGSNPQEKTEKLSKLTMKSGEMIILKDNGFIYNYNENDEYYHVLILTNQSLYVIVDDEEEKFNDIIRIPLSQINQCIYHKGGFFGESYIELFRTDAIDKIELSFSKKGKLALWDMAINDRFKIETSVREYEYYKSVDIKKLK